jgi:hypothetical protein
MEGREAYRSLRYVEPDVVRNLRAAIDMGISPAKLKRLGNNPRQDIYESAIDFMVETPTVGCVVWDGPVWWNWKDESAAEDVEATAP